ncbi:hypothetical protein GCM10011352_00450 [Marinobacterium zhoushanense]|uniref:Hemerythrin-like domain-containing protein n=1 Tax=Marinobacterium zhoushanense TaxID=1679163 RepID=A0ABQ1JYZ4_9GAMM|nr:hemerythrin family protein [Marinobacterium zhoushanense]GGB78750.1 hypothetical protein GCM10011352_00450 [Marinobacterium zhoushanense]
MSDVQRLVLPEVALAFMNADHAQAVELIEQLEQLTAPQGLLAALDRQAISATLNQLYEHNREHFAHEEREMLRVDFPAYPVHRNEHERVLAQIEQACRQWKASGDLGHLREYLSLLPNWLLNHVATMDKVTADFISHHSEQGGS